MKEIPLTQGQVAIVDDEDFEELSKYKWCAKWDKDTKSYYAHRGIQINGKWTTQYMHRLILGLEHGDKRQVDHINHNTLDNRKYNLSIVSNRQNHHNRKRKGTSIYSGVHWNKKDKKWQAKIRINGQYKHLGYFTNEIDAFNSYCMVLGNIGESLYAVK